MQPTLRERIFSCTCSRCRAVVYLIESMGADIRINSKAAGRLCELAVVAAYGERGISEDQVVKERRAYAKHLGIELSGPTSNSDVPGHIQWATLNSNHNSRAKNRINIGSARATFRDGIYTLR